MLDFIRFAWQVHRLTAVARRGRDEILALQEKRWRRLLHHARTQSPFYRRRLDGLDLDRCRITDVPPLTKAELMEHFDEIVTDRRIKLADVTRFMDDPNNLGQAYLGRYSVCHTSGSQGQPAVVVQERTDMWLGVTTQATRGQKIAEGGPLPAIVLDRLIHPARLAVVTQKPGFYPSGATFAYLAAASLPFLRLLRLSVFTPTEETVDQLNHFQPHFITGYTSSLEVLAHEQQAGRLRLEKNTLLGLTNTSEPLPELSREFIEQVFGVHVSDSWSMAECEFLSSGCPVASGAHVNADLAVLEVVDDDYRPVPDGVAGTRVLVTNLVNFVQPMIRYEVGDVVTMSPTPCPCGSPFPHIAAIEGRTKERFWVKVDGTNRELPYYLFLAGLHHCTELAEHQVLQTGVNRFVVRVAPQPGKTISPERVGQFVHGAVAAEGLGDLLDIDVEVVDKIPPEPGSGKMKRAQNLVGPPPELHPMGG
jgi:phenylacetate-CoA ligase